MKKLEAEKIIIQTVLTSFAEGLKEEIEKKSKKLTVKVKVDGKLMVEVETTDDPFISLPDVLTIINNMVQKK